MSDVQEIAILVEIREQLKAMNVAMNDVKIVLCNDRSMMWKVLALTIVGAFAIIGVKIAFP